MAAQTFVAISELHPNIYHPKVAGITIWKSDVRRFPDRTDNGTHRFTFGFTLKDSPDFFINVTAWGSDGYINGLSNSFCIGDCVTIENPLISNKDAEKGERFCPTTPSHYRLLVSEAHSQVGLCADMETINKLLPLIRLPVKDLRDFYSLGDIVANGRRMDGTMLNILAAVKSIGELKHFTTSEGRKGQRLEVKLFDDSASSFSLICWDREVIQLMQSLNPGETVLFIADAKIRFDSFRKDMVAAVNSKTIITVNPDTREASLLFTYAKEAFESGALVGDEMSEDIPVDSITDVYTVNQLKQKGRDTSEPFFGITYSFVSKLDLNLSVSKVIKMWCSRCKFQVSDEAQTCTNNLCPRRDQPFSTTTGFDLMVDFTDHTGTLQACTLRSPVAENMLGCTPGEFFSLTEDERTTLKWKFLLERCKVYMKIIPSTKMRSGFKGIVLACLLADPGEVKQHMSALLQ